MNLRNAKYIKDQGPIEDSCECPACRDFSRGYLRHLLKAEEILGLRLVSLHNLHFYLNLMTQVRAELEAGTFQAFREQFVGGYRKHTAELDAVGAGGKPGQVEV